MQMSSERMRAQTLLLHQWVGSSDLADKDILEIGCGIGTNLLNLIALGAAPERIVGNDLIEERINAAASRLPAAVRLHLGDGSRLPDEFGPFDLIIQFVVFSSILDDVLLSALAERMWSALRPGGAILSYDFTVNNPSNPDVRGIPVRRLRALFPEGHFTVKRVTVAPPLARRTDQRLYPFLAMFPFLKTHCLCLIRKA
jgi:SAM-dependent methyltransferase